MLFKWFYLLLLFCFYITSPATTNSLLKESLTANPVTANSVTTDSLKINPTTTNSVTTESLTALPATTNSLLTESGATKRLTDSSHRDDFFTSYPLEDKNQAGFLEHQKKEEQFKNQKKAILNKRLKKLKIQRQAGLNSSQSNRLFLNHKHKQEQFQKNRKKAFLDYKKKHKNYQTRKQSLRLERLKKRTLSLKPSDKN